jgi:predicted dehydrogenase
MHTLIFPAPEHFHATLTLRERHPLVSDEIAVYAAAEADVADFLALVASFNARPARPTGWRPRVRLGGDPLERAIAERAGDLVVLAGRNDRKARCIRRLHDAGLPVLADKPWMTGLDGLDDLRKVLAGPPLALEMMTGRHEITTALERLLVGAADVFGDFARDSGAAIAFESVHHLEKRVNDAPLRRPAWYFDVRVQGDGLADIPTHLVDHAQQLAGDGSTLELIAARCWPTRVPRDLFARVTGVGDFPDALRDRVEDGGLAYYGNAALSFRCGGVTVETSTRWELTEPPGGGDAHRARLRGTRADIHVVHDATTGWRRRLLVEPRSSTPGVEQALRRRVADWRATLPGLDLEPAERGFEVVIPAALRTPHESHFPRVLDEFLGYADRGEWPARRMADTLAKYELLAQARAVAGRG